MPSRTVNDHGYKVRGWPPLKQQRFPFDTVISLCRQLRTPVRIVRLANLRVGGATFHFGCHSRHWATYGCWHSAGDAKQYKEQEPYQSQYHGQNLIREAISVAECKHGYKVDSISKPHASRRGSGMYFEFLL